jgi:hypothetical protein
MVLQPLGGIRWLTVKIIVAGQACTFSTMEYATIAVDGADVHRSGISKAVVFRVDQNLAAVGSVDGRGSVWNEGLEAVGRIGTALVQREGDGVVWGTRDLHGVSVGPKLLWRKDERAAYEGLLARELKLRRVGNAQVCDEVLGGWRAETLLCDAACEIGHGLGRAKLSLRLGEACLETERDDELASCDLQRCE